MERVSASSKDLPAPNPKRLKKINYVARINMLCTDVGTEMVDTVACRTWGGGSCELWQHSELRCSILVRKDIQKKKRAATRCSTVELGAGEDPTSWTGRHSTFRSHGCPDFSTDLSGPPNPSVGTKDTTAAEMAKEEWDIKNVDKEEEPNFDTTEHALHGGAAAAGREEEEGDPRTFRRAGLHFGRTHRVCTLNIRGSSWGGGCHSTWRPSPGKKWTRCPGLFGDQGRARPRCRGLVFSGLCPRRDGGRSLVCREGRSGKVQHGACSRPVSLLFKDPIGLSNRLIIY